MIVARVFFRDFAQSPALMLYAEKKSSVQQQNSNECIVEDSFSSANKTII